MTVIVFCLKVVFGVGSHNYIIVPRVDGVTETDIVRRVSWGSVVGFFVGRDIFRRTRTSIALTRLQTRNSI